MRFLFSCIILMSPKCLWLVDRTPGSGCNKWNACRLQSFLSMNVFMPANCQPPHSLHERTQKQILPLLASSCDICLLWIWHTKLCNQIRESTTLLYQIFQRLKMFTSDLPWWHMDFDQLVPFILGLYTPSNSKTRLSGLTVQCHEERKQINNTVSGLQRQILICKKEAEKTEKKQQQKRRKQHHLGAASLCPSWCLQSTLSTLDAWEESPPTHCILYALTHFDSRMHHREQLF